MSIVYEVNLEVDSSISQAFESWLKDHIKQMLKIDGFLGAKLYCESRESAHSYWCVHYQVTSHSHLQAYFETQAMQMRQEGISRFGNLMKASRRILEHVE